MKHHVALLQYNNEVHKKFAQIPSLASLFFMSDTTCNIVHSMLLAGNFLAILNQFQNLESCVKI